MISRNTMCAGVLVMAFAGSLSAQEPKPVKILATYLAQDGGIDLDFAWRFAPGDDAGLQSPQLDDSRWVPVKPQLTQADLPAGSWPGVGWFRRHLLIDPLVQGRPIAIRIAATGLATVYLDGRLLLSPGRADAPPEIPYPRRDGCVARLDGNEHVLAVRYEYPRSVLPVPAGMGFRVSLGSPGVLPGAAEQPVWMGVLQGAIIALPVFLVLLHLALFAFDRKARENLFYAGEMLAFAVIVIREYRFSIVQGDAGLHFIDQFALGVPLVAVTFGLLTYYAVRINRYPKTLRPFMAAAVILFIACYVVPNASEYIWMAYFFAVIAEIIRLERRGGVRRHKGTQFFVVTFAVFCVAIVLQMFVNFHVFDSVAGTRQVYLFGIFASAIGMSMYLARTLGQSRVVEAENARKTAELAQARDLQLSMLPKELPRVAGLDVAAMTMPAAEVGGDYYDVRAAGDGSLLFAFGDATGHGLAAGIVVTAAKALFASLQVDDPPTSLLRGCDAALRSMQLPSLRMCLSLARVSRDRITVASAAMPPILIHRSRTNTIDELGTGGLPLGSRLTAQYEERSASLEPGDTLLFASDGFAELVNAEGLQLGYDGVAKALLDGVRSLSAADLTATGIMMSLYQKVSAYRGAVPAGDDITFVVVHTRDRLGENQ
jgi:Stage II sporulation protein E (SpoIIE)/7TM diverse intracellular signalling